MKPTTNEDGVHRIRLKGPWNVKPPGTTEENFERHSMPQDWRALFGNRPGTAVYRRNFHTPSGLESHNRVLIYVPIGVGELSCCSINGIEIDPTSLDPLKFDITDSLTEFNLLQFSLTFEPSREPDVPGGLWETVFLEIHSGSV